LECFAVLNLRFLLTGISRERRNTVCISSTMDFLWGKRFIQNRVNPYVNPPNHFPVFLQLKVFFRILTKIRSLRSGRDPLTGIVLKLAAGAIYSRDSFFAAKHTIFIQLGRKFAVAAGTGHFLPK
jgi:hypothetical protein